MPRPSAERVAGQVTERVVDLFEAVEIHEQQAGRGVALDGARESIEQEGPIAKAGQRVVSCLKRQRFLDAFALGDVT